VKRWLTPGAGSSSLAGDPDGTELRQDLALQRNRRMSLKALAAGLGLPCLAAATVAPVRAATAGANREGSASMKMNTRPIPSSGESLPVVGCGTYVGFDVQPGTDAYRELPAVLQALFDAGGSVIDSSPMYGRAETTVGELLAAVAVLGRAFIATKVWTSSRERGISRWRSR
jgi:hypothetical protein